MCPGTSSAAGSRATRPAACATAVTAQHRRPARGQAAGEVAEAVGDGRGEGEGDGHREPRTAEWTEQDSAPHVTASVAGQCNTMDREVRHTVLVQSSDDVAAAVGRNVRALRQQRRMTIDALAAAAGLSRGTVIQIETARGNPSIATLCNLATALRVGVGSLVDGDAVPALVVRRAEQAAPLWTSPAGSTAVFRIGTDPPDVVELWDWTAAARRLVRRGGAPDGHGRRCCRCWPGHLALRVGDAELELATGDTVMFEAHAPHRYACAAAGPVRFTMVVLQPGDAGLVPPDEHRPGLAGVTTRTPCRLGACADRSSPRSAPPDPLSGSGSTARRAGLPPRRNAGNPTGTCR